MYIYVCIYTPPHTQRDTHTPTTNPKSHWYVQAEFRLLSAFQKIEPYLASAAFLLLLIRRIVLMLNTPISKANPAVPFVSYRRPNYRSFRR